MCQIQVEIHSKTGVDDSKLHHLLTKDLLIINGVRMRRSLVNLSGLVKSVTKMVTGYLRTTKVLSSVPTLCVWRN